MTGIGPRLRVGGRLVAKAARHPGRAALRLLLRARLRRLDPDRDHARFLAWLADEFGVDGAALSAEYHVSPFRQDYLARVRALRESARLRLGTTDEWCLRALYLLVRAARPRVLVETGVLYGASSAHILAALAANREGELHSIDLPRQPGEPAVDYLITGDLKQRWTLREGDSRRELPELLERHGAIDLFHHDSLHTFEHMTWEYGTALSYLTPRGVLSSHDVLVAHSIREIFRPNAFPVFCERHGLRWSTFQNCGFAMVKGSAGRRAGR